MGADLASGLKRPPDSHDDFKIFGHGSTGSTEYSIDVTLSLHKNYP